MTQNIHLWLQGEEMTRFAGASLSHSLYDIPVTIWLTGELGTGKTTFLQAFARELGVRGVLSSPTFALEQRYQTNMFGELLHIDLYRLSSKESCELIHSSADHPGIRCVEWSERIPVSERMNGIVISLHDRNDGTWRELSVDFYDFPVPTDDLITRWRDEFFLTSLVRRHCDAVADVAVRLSHSTAERGVIVRIQALRAAAKLHDLFRFLDFRSEAAHGENKVNMERSTCWKAVRTMFPGIKHEAACAAFLSQHGYQAVGRIVQTHGITLASAEGTTIEQKLLYYADKRVKHDEVVPLEERFRDYAERYGSRGVSSVSETWHEEARSIEKELFPDGPPF